MPGVVGPCAPVRRRGRRSSVVTATVVDSRRSARNEPAAVEAAVCRRSCCLCADPPHRSVQGVQDPSALISVDGLLFPAPAPAQICRPGSAQIRLLSDPSTACCFLHRHLRRSIAQIHRTDPSCCQICPPSACCFLHRHQRVCRPAVPVQIHPQSVCCPLHLHQRGHLAPARPESACPCADLHGFVQATCQEFWYSLLFFSVFLLFNMSTNAIFCQYCARWPELSRMGFLCSDCIKRSWFTVSFD
jgi:hypothetical protein